jgi:hypothetical protein
MVDQRGLAALRAESTRGFGAGEEDLDGKLKFSSYTGLPIPISCRSRADNSLASKTHNASRESSVKTNRILGSKGTHVDPES